jgi:elongation factor Ts
MNSREYLADAFTAGKRNTNIEFQTGRFPLTQYDIHSTRIGVFNMAEISAAMVMKLRKMTGQGMMDCKRALQEANGDIEKAMDILRKKGLATLAKRAERETSEGLVVCKANEDGKTAAIATLCCETDFVAKSDDFIATAQSLADYALACSAEKGAENILETVVDGIKFSDVLTEMVSKTGEKTQVGDYAKYKLNGPGLISTYIHFNEKVGTMVQIETSDDNVAAADVLKQTASDMAMHITATKPLALDKDQIDPETIEREKSIFAGQVKNKPANIIEKIIEGKMRKFFAENCLLDQPFVKDDSKSVAQVLADAAKQAGGEAKIKRFVRFEVG